MAGIALIQTKIRYLLIKTSLTTRLIGTLQSMGSDMQHKGFDAQIKETNDELSKFDSTKMGLKHYWADDGCEPGRGSVQSQKS